MADVQTLSLKVGWGKQLSFISCSKKMYHRKSEGAMDTGMFTPIEQCLFAPITHLSSISTSTELGGALSEAWIGHKLRRLCHVSIYTG